MTYADPPSRQCARQPRQLACGVEVVGAAPVDLRVLATGHFLIGQARADDQPLVGIRLAKGQRRGLPESLQQGDLETASRLVELLRMLLRQS